MRVCIYFYTFVVKIDNSHKKSLLLLRVTSGKTAQEKNLKSIKTDASLYNGQPTDTGVKCHLADQQRVIVELFCSCLVATAYIPKEAMRKIS